MSPRMIVLETIAVVAGAIIGLLVVDFFHWLFADGAFFALVSSLGRIVVALVTVGLFAFYYRSMPPTAAALASFFTGVGLPAILDKFGFDSPLSWGTLLFLYAIFAVVALFTYRFVHANAAVRRVTGEIAPGDGPNP
ncbi:MAG TPA: hypothetical protein VIN77_14815 [Aurantimonas sp.]|uniref:Uncharacterized protein n=1 Tax=Aurantimonas marianensis TaxID=2920428 RepID=A0A9X2HAJ5_9HYPH|nr:hypothetical protein [Aurantimonas marianensis]MCP3054019.1 hypothetical protein [Aurantimonas marianensis]